MHCLYVVRKLHRTLVGGVSAIFLHGTPFVSTPSIKDSQQIIKRNSSNLESEGYDRDVTARWLRCDTMIGTPSLSDDGAELVERMEQSFSCKEVAEW